METYLSYLGVDGVKDDPPPPLSIKPPVQTTAPVAAPDPTAPIAAAVTRVAAAPALAAETSVVRIPGSVNVASSLQAAKDQLQPIRLPRAESAVGETCVDYVAPPTPAAGGGKPALKAKDAVKPKPASKAVLPAAPAHKSSALLIVAAVVVCGLGVGVWVLPMVFAKSSSAPVNTPVAAGPRPPRTAITAPAALSSPGVEKCLRQSSQTIDSQLRDELLRQIVADVDTGKHAQALTGLRRYTAEACDRATLEAVAILNHQLVPRHKK